MHTGGKFGHFWSKFPGISGNFPGKFRGVFRSISLKNVVKTPVLHSNIEDFGRFYPPQTPRENSRKIPGKFCAHGFSKNIKFR